MKENVQTLTTRRRIRTCGPHVAFIFVLNAYLLLLLWRRKTQKYYSAYADKDQFMKAVEPFSSVDGTSRLIAGQDFLKAKDLDSDQRALLRFFITDYLKFHRANRANGTRRLVYKPGEVGNGDRFNCMMYAYWVSVLSRRVFLLDWDEPFPLSLFLTSAGGTNFFLDQSEKNISLSLRQRCIPPSCVLLTHEHSTVSNLEKTLPSKTKTIYLYTHSVPTAVPGDLGKHYIPKNIRPIVLESFRSGQSFKRAVLHHVLKLSDSIVNDHKKIAKKMRLTPGTIRRNGKSIWGTLRLNDPLYKNERQYISVQARLGSGVGEGGTRFNNVAARLQEVAVCLASRAVRLAIMSGSPPVPIFLATDTTEFREVFKKVVKKIDGNVDVVYGNWSTIHVAKVHPKDRNASGKGHGKPWESVWGGFMDLVLLGHAEHIVALYSGFPRLAYSLGDADTLVELRNEMCLGK